MSWAETDVGLAVDTGPSERPTRGAAEAKRGRSDANETKESIKRNRVQHVVVQKNKRNKYLQPRAVSEGND